MSSRGLAVIHDWELCIVSFSEARVEHIFDQERRCRCQEVNEKAVWPGGEPHAIYTGENAQDQFEYKLEQALETQYKYIVMEPTRIGDETARWITVGNCLHKTTVLAGTACLCTPLTLPLEYFHYISLPAGVLSLACCTLYGIAWQFDPCCKYQVEYDAYKLSRLPLHTLTSSTPVVLVRKDDLHRKRLYNTIDHAALAYCIKKIYELYLV
ncbi:PREDICTED: transmembrane protein 11, mitochondrial-like [Chrysochloris asiatica]|uniref:Transmembrane protein 11, mitochondrial-like n=1 Tax=Chrysochloris asiatica TaxID=185453 RepID=A0A9B0U1T3_CHRAS|nr:PREDICTED: transmembrane protein 11, mitochondrial-like [Chrysochloris asiatica]